MRRARFSLRSLLLAMVLLVLALPLAGLLFLRMYESALIRQTESELVSQAAVVAAAFKAQRLAHGTTDATRAEIVPGPLEIARRPGLDLAYDRVLPPPADPVPSSPASDGAAEAGAALQPVLREAQGVTLAAMRVLDPAGVIVATTGNDLGQSLAAQDEVRRALRGEPVSVMRRREKLARWMPEGISRGSALRVYVALPVLDDDRVLGAVLVVRTPADISQALWGKRWELAALGIVLLGVGAGLALAVSRLITRPLALVTAQATRVAAGSTGAVEALARPGTREVAALSAAIVAMADTLDRRATYVRTLAAHIAHEFKTPLAATRGAAELLGDHAMSQAERDRFVGVIEAEVARLDRLTRRLLDLARADMADGRVGGPTNLRPTLEAAAARYAERGLQVTLGAGEARVAMRGEALELMLDGLLDNALAHGGQTVEIAVRREADCVVIRVADDGPGISTANAARVFEPFFTTARERGGTGLGLPIVQALAAGVGGGVRLATARSGAAFEIELPAA